MNRVLSIKSRKSMYAIAAPLITLLVSFDVLDKTEATLWIALAGGVLGIGIAALNTQSGLRRWIYGLAAPVQAILLGYGALNDEQVYSIVGLAVTMAAITLAGVNVEVGDDGSVDLPGFGPSQGGEKSSGE